MHAGETVDLNLYNDDNETHEILVTTNASADPQRANTSTEHALHTPTPLPPGNSISAYEITIPREADALYAWCRMDDHEAEGERLVISLARPHAEPDDRLGPTLGVLGLVAALLLALEVARRRP